MRQYGRASGLFSGFTLTFTDPVAGDVRTVDFTVVCVLDGTVASTVDSVGILPVGVVCGTLNKLGVGYGVQIATLYSSPRIVLNLL